VHWYCTEWYSACSSTIGFGDIAAQSANERLFCVFAMIVGGGIFAYGITNVSARASIPIPQLLVLTHLYSFGCQSA
jgi:hypothetical protein